MAYERQYTHGVGWQNEPSLNTPINAENLNQMDQAIMDVDAAVAEALEDVSVVVANPSGSASTDLNKLKVGSTIYSISGGARAYAYEIGRDDLAQVIPTSKTTPIELSVSNFSKSTGTLVFFRLGRAATLDWEPSGVSSSDYGLYFNINDTGTMQAYHNDVAISGASVYNLEKEKLYVGHLRSIFSDVPTWRFEIHEIDDMGEGGDGGINIYAEYVVGQHKAMNNPNMEMASMPFNVNNLAVGDLLFLYINTQADLIYDGDTERSTWWLAVHNGQHLILPVVDSRQESNIHAYFREDLKAGSTLILSALENSGIVGYFGVRAIIPAAGGGGGTTVIANPSGTATDDLEKLQVGNTIYDIPTATANTLAGLTDTTISSPTAAQPLTYDATNNKWVNGGVIPVANGGTGNADGYIRTGQKANTTAGNYATLEGKNTTATHDAAHAEGELTQAIEKWAHAEGNSTKASGRCAHAEGSATTASGQYSHAEGGGSSVASGASAHSEGTSTTASGNYSHAEGQGAKAQAQASHAQNYYTTASANYSSAAGYYTTAGYESQFVVGKYNDNKSGNAFEVGWGTNVTHANVLEVSTSGNLKTAGTITDGNGNVLGQPVTVDGVWVVSGETATLTVVP